MMSEKKQCLLQSLSNQSNQILLPDMSELCLGRSPITHISDKTCSRNQVSVMANYKTHQVTVRHLGGNPSTANGNILRNQTHVLNHGEVLEMISGKYPYRVEFSPSPDLTDTNSEKRQWHDLNDLIPNVKRPRNEQKGDVSKDDDQDLCIGKNKQDAKSGKVVCDNSISKNNIGSISRPIENGIEDDLDERGVASINSQWEDVDSGTLLIYTSAGVQSSSKIAAYDLDGTIILTKSGRVFPKDRDDWRIGFPSVKQKLISLIENGFKVVVFTNQAGIERGKTKAADFKYKIEKILGELNVPVQVFVATSQNIYRKPAPGMWRILKEKKNSGIKINTKKSFYIGDGAGRIVHWAPGKKKDFSCADRLFALNLGLTFFTPEEHFLKQNPAKYVLPDFNPAELVENQPICDSSIFKNTKEVIILVGYPGSGKSFFAQKYLLPEGYVHVNRDTLNTWQRCVSTMEAALQSNKSVVVDNTNPDKESRSRFISKAKALKTTCRCFIMSTSLEHAKHNNKFREFTDKKHIPVNAIIINSYKSKLQNPSLDEGFEEIVTVNFVPKFDDPELKKLYMMYLV